MKREELQIEILRLKEENEGLKKKIAMPMHNQDAVVLDKTKTLAAENRAIRQENKRLKEAIIRGVLG